MSEQGLKLSSLILWFSLNAVITLNVCNMIAEKVLSSYWFFSLILTMIVSASMIKHILKVDNGK